MKEEKELYYIYVLLLVDDRYYIGSTKNFDRRFRQHSQNRDTGSVYVKKYSIVNIEKVVVIYATFWDAIIYENIITIYYGSKYGYYKVRGGNFTVLDDNIIVKQFECTLKERIIKLKKINFTINRMDIIKNFNKKINVLVDDIDLISDYKVNSKS